MDDAQFFEAFARRPEDLHLRSVYADWLEERGDHWRANFVRLWLRSVPWLELPGWHAETNPFRGQSYFFDREWQRRVFDPPIPLAPRRDRRWLAALLGGRDERAAMGEEAPPSILDEAAFGTNLLWGWPSELLVRLAVAAARDAIEACAVMPATSDLPRAELLTLIARVEEAAASGTIYEVEALSRRDRRNGRTTPADVAYDLAVRLPELLASMLCPYQARRQEVSRPGMTVSVVSQAVRVHEQLGWAARGFARKHAAKEQAVKVAAAANERAEKAQRALASAAARLEANGMPSGEISRIVAERTRRRDRARDVAVDAQTRADELVAVCPSAPSFHGELRRLFVRVAPGLVTWLRAEADDFESEVHVRNKVEEEIDRYNTVWTITYAEDGRVSTTYGSVRR